uniref:Uncharacterized protein n=1 Tax=Candidatus Kentrum sp. UNK TaxID=2126344 RepID=A0A450ZYF4_9GAMM|nr:MAG: hypothetical protein BECKUNK1418G_GA0071005_10053 [Candidatus Kentron sp. UNK]VFK68573.1 MAG: hypothetical protein BECKUNK1418H_GA0071006_10043 [Candidatus Kentron sp. UNK]
MKSFVIPGYQLRLFCLFSAQLRKWSKFYFTQPGVAGTKDFYPLLSRHSRESGNPVTNISLIFLDRFTEDFLGN